MISNRAEPHPLTDLGRRQAAALADALRPERVRRILASPIPRALETAEIVGRAIGVPVEVADALREFDCGEYEGRSDDDAWAAHTAIVRDWLELGLADSRLPGGERLTDLRARFDPFIQRLIRDVLAAGPGPGGGGPGSVLVVSHGGLLRCVLPALLDDAAAAFVRGRYLANAELLRADVRPDGTLSVVPSPSVRARR